MYTFDSRIRYSETDSEGKLTMASIINYFQDCSTFQSEDLGLGVAKLRQMHLVWVLSSWQIVVERYPDLCEEITIATWPYYFQSFCGYRNFVMKDRKGQMLAYANALWSFLDTDTGRPVRVPEDIEKVYILEEKLDMNYASRKVPMPRDGERKEPFAVQKHHLDTNHHVNNGQYIQMAREYIPEDFPIRQMRAEYKKPALLGDMIYPVVQREDNRYMTALCDELGHPYAVVEVS